MAASVECVDDYWLDRPYVTFPTLVVVSTLQRSLAWEMRSTRGFWITNWCIAC